MPNRPAFAVTNTDDSGPGTLRQAIADASPGDVIDLSGLSGTITLTSGHLTIDKSLTIKGPGAKDLTIARSAATAFRILHITAGTVAISGVTISGGEANAADPGGPSGGGISVTSGATLGLSQCAVTNNAATGIGFGGGMQVFEATATIDRCTFNGNTAPSGAGINVNTGTVTLVNSTVSGNVSGFTGGGLQIMTHPGGSTSTLNVIYSTIASNTATEGAGVHMFGVGTEALVLSSSIIAGNIATMNGAKVDISDPFGGNVITADHSLVETAGIPAGTGNLVGVSPVLGPLADNGGSTLTHELLAGSPAMEKGDDATCAAEPVSARDQVGHVRPRGMHCDMGSFEGDAPGNDAPIAAVGGPYVGVEGSDIALSFSAVDTDGDPLTYSWDFGNGVKGSGPVPPQHYTYLDNAPMAGSFTVTLTVTDPSGAKDTKKTTATIANVAPSVTASLSATAVTSGQTVQLSGTFTDPGVLDAPWNYQVTWGNGPSTTGVSTPGGTIAKARQYCAVGAYAVALVVTDKDGASGVQKLPLMVSAASVSIKLPDAISLNGSGTGAVAVGVLSKAGFDAPALVNPATATLGGPTGPRVGVTTKKNGAFNTGIADLDNNGIADLILHFDRQAMIKAGAITPATTQLVLRAQLGDGCSEIEGQGPVTVVP